MHSHRDIEYIIIPMTAEANETGTANGRSCKRMPKEPKIATQSSESIGLMNGREFQLGALRPIFINAKIVRKRPSAVPMLTSIMIQCGCFPPDGENT